MSADDTAASFAGKGDVWKPRLRVSIGRAGITDPSEDPHEVVPTALSAKVEKNNFFQADRFTVVFSLWMDEAYSYGYWIPFNTLGVKVEIAFEGVVDYTEVYRGFADKITIDPIKGTVTVSGRNAFSLFIDSQISVNNEHATIGDIIDALCEKVGFPADHIIYGEGFPKDKEIGRVFDDLRTSGALGAQSVLGGQDFIVNIVQQVGGNMWVEGGYIHFDLDGNDEVITVIAPQGTFENGVTKLSPSNATSLTIEHDLTISQYNHQVCSHCTLPTGETKTAKHPEELPDNGLPAKQHHVWVGNQTEDDNAEWADSSHGIFTLHEWVVTWKCAGPQLIGVLANDQFDLVGTNTDADGWYQIMSIEHSIDFRKGYTGTLVGQWGRTTADTPQPAGGNPEAGGAPPAGGLT